jgi:membrane-bound lytic murein transglycosylase B
MNRRFYFTKKISSAFLIVSILLTAILPVGIFADSIDRQEAKLREELERLEEEAKILEASLNKQRQNSASIERDVNILASEIQQAENRIAQKNLEIQNLRSTINTKEQTITELDAKMERAREDLAYLIKRTNEADMTTLPEILLSNRNLSDFFQEFDEYKLAQRQLEDLFEDIREIQNKAEEEKASLEVAANQERDARAVIENQKQTVVVKKNEQDNLLSMSKKSEATYESILQQRRAEAAAIRTALFQLRDSAGIPFGDALRYAEKASRATGVRTAFILAVLKQESDLGKNVGTCNRAGDPPNKKWTSIMPGPNDGHRSYRDDQTVFLRITDDLGLDPDSTPLSCPWGNGWGGAMGPSQFIPTTWQAYEARIASAVGVRTPNPWDPEHAIMATAIYMKDLGAAAGGYTAERTAALKYYAGGNWNLPQNAFYGNGVLAHATEMQRQIDFLEDVDNE